MSTSTSQQTLTKAIEKTNWSSTPFELRQFPGVDGLCIVWQFANGDHQIDHLFQLIYNREFAQRLWGEEAYPFPDGISGGMKYINPVYKWENNLQRMVVAEDPIAFLEANI